MKASDLATDLSVLGALYDQTVTSILQRRYEELDSALAVTFDDRELTYGDLWRDAKRFAEALEATPSSQPGDRVCAILDNQWQYLTTLFGTILAGRIFVPLNTAYQRPQLEFVLGDVEPAIVVVSEDYLPLVEGVASEQRVPPLIVTVVLGATARSPNGQPSQWTIDFEAFLGSGLPNGRIFQPRPDTAAIILYTSGTTGQSKGIIYCHRAVLWFAGIACYALELSDDDVLHTCLPLFHANALLCTVLAGVIVGARSVVMPRFTLSGFWQELTDCGATVTSLLGSMPTLLWRAPQSDGETSHGLRLAYSAPLPTGAAEFQERFNLPLATTYGLTDASILTVGRAGPECLTGSCGRAFSDWELKIVNDNDEPVPAGYVGEMIARPRLPYIGGAGYWRNAEATAESWRNLWHHTGDLLTQDEGGSFYYRERKKDSIRKAGENVASFEVEQAISGVPAVEQVAVFGVPADLGDDEIMAVLVVREGHQLALADLRDHCRTILPYFAVPRYWEITTALPLTETSRVKKSELRARGITAATWDSGPVRRGSNTGGTRQR